MPEHARAQAKLQPETIQAFDTYAADVEAQFGRRLRGETPFLWTSEDQERAAAVAHGEVVVEPSAEAGWHRVSNGIVHDWTAAVLVPDAAVERVVQTVTAYDTHAKTYAPSVTRSRILEREGGNYTVSMRMVKRNVLSAVLETEHKAEFRALDDARWWGLSRSTSIREVQRPGKPNESLRPVGDDNGFLWRLNVYWRFAETADGTIAEHRAVTLTRGLPKAVRWMMRPVLVALPRDAITDVMEATRDGALAAAR